jgi:hypothetical protein
MKTPDSANRPDGRALSPVIGADSKFFGSPPSLCVDVRFSTIEQLDELIAALSKLREFPFDGYDHVHLQDSAHGLNATSAEVTFWHPAVQRTDIDGECLAEAATTLSKFQPSS